MKLSLQRASKLHAEFNLMRKRACCTTAPHRSRRVASKEAATHRRRRNYCGSLHQARRLGSRPSSVRSCRLGSRRRWLSKPGCEHRRILARKKQHIDVRRTVCMGLIRVKRSTYECDDLLFHNHGGAPLHSQGRQRRAAKVMRWTAWHFVNLKYASCSSSCLTKYARLDGSPTNQDV